MDSSGAQLAMSGADRVVRVVDLHKLQPVGQWNNCLKYACRSLQIKADGRSCYVAGIDNEVACGGWEVGGGHVYESSDVKIVNAPPAPRMVSGALARSPRRLYGFRGDARWVGTCTSGDNFASLSTSGAFYLLRGS